MAFRPLVLLFLLSLTLRASGAAATPPARSPIDQYRLDIIVDLFRRDGLPKANVTITADGRVKLTGNFKNSDEVDRAFAIAQSVVGVRWVSRLTPESIEYRYSSIHSALQQAMQRTTPPKDSTSSASGQIVIETPPPPTAPRPPDPPEGKQQGFALIVGISRFQNDTTGKNLLHYTDDDARRMKDFIVSRRIYAPENIHLLIDEDATAENIRGALKKIQAQAGQDDEVLIHFASHGAPVLDGLNIVTYETKLTKDMYQLGKTSFPASELKTFLAQTYAGEVLVFLDVCFSGAAFKDMEGFYHESVDKDTLADENLGYSRADMATGLLGASSRDLVLDDDSDVLVIGKNEGKQLTRVLISASSSEERSYESPEIQAGYFTYFLVSFLRSKQTLKDAFEEASPAVTSKVAEKEHKSQHPQAVVSTRDWSSVAIGQ